MILPNDGAHDIGSLDKEAQLCCMLYKKGEEGAEKCL